MGVKSQIMKKDLITPCRDKTRINLIRDRLCYIDFPDPYEGLVAEWLAQNAYGLAMKYPKITKAVLRQIEDHVRIDLKFHPITDPDQRGVVKDYRAFKEHKTPPEPPLR